MAAIEVAAHIKKAAHVEVVAHVEVAAHVKEAHHIKKSDSSTMNRLGAKDTQPAQAKPTERSIGGGTCELRKLLKVETDIKP